MHHIYYLIASKLLEGAKNGAYYANRTNERNGYMLMMLAGSILYYPTASVVMLVLLIVQYMVFETNRSKWIHSTEYLVSWTIYWSAILNGADLLGVISSVLLLEVIFKMPINIYIGRRAIERVDGTNDPTGKTVDFWLFGKQYHVPRISNGYITLALGIVTFGLWLVSGVRITLQELILIINL